MAASPAAPGHTCRRGVIAGSVRVVVVDQHAVWREGMRATLARHPDLRIVGESGSAAEAPALVERLRPTVVLLDPTIRLAGRPVGIDVCRDVVARSRGSRVLVLGPVDNERCVLAALDAGATGYLGRDATLDQVVSGVRAVAAGRRTLDRRSSEALLRASTPAAPPPEQALTGRQLEVLRLLASGMSNRDIAGALTVSEGTVKFHLAKIMRRLDAPGRAAAVYAASRQGLI
ncbi:LuxR C-terminal-related transcriptional regulator [Pseudonocardia sp.]|uniref:LuxR C-terminal-related transcriptional regulator n=1 Tax=Pseudonocardia sp. TaxID=60912 RepID=UPI003D14DD73